MGAPVSEPRASRFARAVVRLRWLIVVGWLAGTVAATLWLPSLEESSSGSVGDLAPTDAAAIDAEIRSSELFGFPLLSRTIVVQRDPRGLSPLEQARVVSRIYALNRDQLPGVERIGGALGVTNALGAPPFTRERSTTALTYLFYLPEVGAGERRDLARRFRERYVADPRAAAVGVTGALAARGAQAEEIRAGLPLVEIGTVLLVLLVTGLHFRAFVAPLVNLVAVAVAYLVAIRVMAGLGERLGVSVPAEVEPVVVVLLFGIITDYCIFYLSRFRFRLAEGRSPAAAAASTVSELTPIITTAGLTVVGACSALLVAQLGFFQAFGPGTALAVAVALLVSITLVPALLAITGRATFWPSRPGADVPAERADEEASDERARRPVRSGLVRLAAGRPVLVCVGCVLILLACASGLSRLEVGNTLIRGLPEDAPARQAYAAAGQGFTPGILSPTVLIVEDEGITRRRGALVQLQRSLERLPGVAQVVGPAQQPLDRDLGAVYSRTQDAVRYLVVFDADPLGAAAIARLRALKRALPALQEGSGLGAARVSIAGDTALSEETVRLVDEDLGRISIAVLAAIFVILAVFLRALVAPVVVIAASVLALAAALGLTTYVFQDLLGYGELTYYVPFTASVLLVALGSDYNVFLTGRIWQESRVRPFREAVTVGAARASKAITVAGIVLAASFALLALVDVRAFRELAFAMGVGLLIDAFLVRTLLVPALLTIVGPAGRWPSRSLSARLPVAGPSPVRPAAPADGAARPGTAVVALTWAVLLGTSLRRRGRARGKRGRG